jgi:prepilin-type N-terminal cleavage/methylation domain-containing protein
MRNTKRRNGFSLIEIIVTMTIMAILLSFTAPSVLRTMEQSHADMAGAGLRMVNTAQRFYWLENRTYAPDMQTLIDADLIDSDLNLTAPRYEFDITTADADGFQARARRRQLDDLGQPVYSGAWQGNFTIDETGTIVGNVQGNASPIDGTVPVLTPAF